MVNWLEENKITIWYTVPTILTFLTLKGNLSKERLPDLKTVLFAGEVFPTLHLSALTQLLPHVEFYNLFGPTETNVCCYWAVDRKIIQDLAVIPIGHPACKDELLINSDGELLVRGPSLMSGYFSKGKIRCCFDEMGWYHTGDRVSTGEKGELYYHGRLDRQLKCNGFRIEPGEVEQAFYAFPDVEECVVFGIEQKVNTSLVACIGRTKEISYRDLMKYLNSNLPSYMIPERVLQMEALPRLGNGKLDLQKIKSFF
jgi:acyl-coenzyme A synthetase/AMP-(fatty) acid ligase